MEKIALGARKSCSLATMKRVLILLLISLTVASGIQSMQKVSAADKERKLAQSALASAQSSNASAQNALASAQAGAREADLDYLLCFYYCTDELLTKIIAESLVEKATTTASAAGVALSSASSRAYRAEEAYVQVRNTYGGATGGLGALTILLAVYLRVQGRRKQAKIVESAERWTCAPCGRINSEGPYCMNCGAARASMSAETTS